MTPDRHRHTDSLLPLPCARKDGDVISKETTVALQNMSCVFLISMTEKLSSPAGPLAQIITGP